VPPDRRSQKAPAERLNWVAGPFLEHKGMECVGGTKHLGWLVTIGGMMRSGGVSASTTGVALAASTGPVEEFLRVGSSFMKPFTGPLW